MKHFLSFSFAFCSIVLAALHLTPTFPDGSLTPKYENQFKAYTPAKTSEILIKNVLFSPGNLPDRINIPAPKVIELCRPMNEGKMDEENLRLNQLLFRDIDPDHSI